MIVNTFFESWPQCVVNKNNKYQDWFCKRKVALKSYGGKTLGGGRSAPPPGLLGLKKHLERKLMT